MRIEPGRHALELTEVRTSRPAHEHDTDSASSAATSPRRRRLPHLVADPRPASFSVPYRLTRPTPIAGAEARSEANAAGRWRVDGQMLLFTLILCVASGLLFGLAPAMGVGRLNLYGTLKDAGRGSAGTTRGNRLRRVLVAAELALSVVVLWATACSSAASSDCNAWLPGQSARRPDTRAHDDRPEVRRRERRAAHLRGLVASPGWVARGRASGGVTSLPLSGYFAWGPITVEGRAPLPGEQFINPDQRVASRRYFEAMGSSPCCRGGVSFTNQDQAK